eukprot:COSAG02_NODE_11980_length_1620_cov_4.507561_4_plen_221_part_00
MCYQRNGGVLTRVSANASKFTSANVLPPLTQSCRQLSGSSNDLWKNSGAKQKLNGMEEHTARVKVVATDTMHCNLIWRPSRSLNWRPSLSAHTHPPFSTDFTSHLYSHIPLAYRPMACRYRSTWSKLVSKSKKRVFKKRVLQECAKKMTVTRHGKTVKGSYQKAHATCRWVLDAGWSCGGICFGCKPGHLAELYTHKTGIKRVREVPVDSQVDSQVISHH